ncbi:amidase [Flavobacterium sp. ZB4P13]|uniref:amidase n=1 Tax=Flavobacterium sp. ZB4P13 TaxID=3401728 RepID=UPI003AAB5D39
MKNIIFESAINIGQKIKSKEISVVEIAEAFLNQIDKHNPKVNAIYQLRDREEIIKEAKEKDLQIANGEKLGLLHGIPINIKDSFLVKGLKTSNGDPMLRNYVATEDAELVKRLKEAGAIILGKTNVALYCIDWQSNNFWNGRTNNPYDLNRAAGGSSGGTAVAVASGFGALDLGADAGGSIRVPAHFNGICGLRPTEGLLSNRGHLKHPKKPQGRRHIITPGPLAKNVEDILLMMQVLTNFKNHPLPEIPNVDFNSTFWNGDKLNIAYAETINSTEVDNEYLTIFNGFINKLKNTEHHIQEESPIYDEKRAYLECQKIIGFEIGINNPKVPLLASFMFGFIYLKYRDFLWAKGMALGQRLSNINYAKAIDYKDQFSAIYQGFLSKYDIWITPVCSFEAYPHQNTRKSFMVNNKKVGYTEAMASFNFTTAFSGHPILVIPIGKKRNGLPVGIQIHSKKWNDKKLLEIAKYFERFTNGFEEPIL